MSKIKNCGLHQYSAGPFEQQQFGTAGVEGVNSTIITIVKITAHVYDLLFLSRRRAVMSCNG